MAIDDFEEDFVQEIDRGLNLLGWTVNIRMTSDDTLLAKRVSERATEAHETGKLDEQTTEQLSWEAYRVLYPSLMDHRLRAQKVAAAYEKSSHLRKAIPLIEEATLAYYRGYDTAALAAFFVALELYLRSLSGWEPGDGKMTFADLRRAVERFDPSRSKRRAERMLAGVYGFYEPLEPPPFYYNRHGLLHGIRGRKEVDEMNCVRTLVLFDTLAAAERNPGSGSVVVEPIHQVRERVYGACGTNKVEIEFLKAVEEQLGG